MRKLPNVFQREQVKKLIRAIDEPWLMVAVFLGLFCGLRRSEVVNLQVQDIDIAGKKLRVENSKNPSRSFEGYGKDRVVPIPECVIPLLQNWLNILGPQEKNVFPSVKNPGSPITGEYLLKAYKNAVRRAMDLPVVKIDSSGLPRHKYNFHTLRHTYATLLWEKTGDIVTVKHALGHSKLETTMIYTHVTNQIVEQKVNDAFATRNSPQKTFSNAKRLDPIGILMKRLALGEINMKTFKDLREELRESKANEHRYR